MASPSNSITIQQIPSKGRGIISTRPIIAGEIILTDSPILLYPANPFKHDYCSNCFKTLTLTLAPPSSSPILSCPNCSQSHHTLYCSPNCQSKALSSFHSPWICQSLNSIHQSSTCSLMSADDLSDLYFLVYAYNLAVISPVNFNLLLSLDGGSVISPISEISPDSKTVALHSLISSLSPPQTFAGCSLELTVALLAKEKRNAFGLGGPFCGETGEVNLRAYGIYPNASLFNHDCLPNVTRFDYVDSNVERNTDIVLRAIHDISQGREICMSYFGVKWSYTDRQKKLSEEYGFVCECDRCKVEVNWKDEEAEEENVSMEENENEQMEGSPPEEEEDCEIVEDDFPHAYFFLNFVCSRENCGGTLAPLPPSDGKPSEIMECNVCGRLRTREEIEADGSESGSVMDE